MYDNAWIEHGKLQAIRDMCNTACKCGVKNMLQTELVYPLSSLEEKPSTCIGNSGEQKSSNLSTISKWTISHHKYTSGIRNRKGHCNLNSVLLYVFCVLRKTDRNRKFENTARLYWTRYTNHPSYIVRTNSSQSFLDIVSFKIVRHSKINLNA